MEDLTIDLEEKDSGLLITVDEADPSNKELIKLIATFQHFAREGRHVILVLAGLPANIDSLVSGKSTSFLRRARKKELSSLTTAQTREALKGTIVMADKDIEQEALEMVVEAVQGFPYMLQLVGYEMWTQSIGRDLITVADAKSAIESALPELEQNIYGATLHELSKKDREFLKAMLLNPKDSKVSEIAKAMNVSPSYANNYKRRLMKQGVIHEIAKGYVDFTMPAFREYIESNIDML